MTIVEHVKGRVKTWWRRGEGGGVVANVAIMDVIHLHPFRRIIELGNNRNGKGRGG